MKQRIFSATMTPLTDNGEFDRVAMGKMIERNLGHGIGGFFIMGTMGEGMLQSPELQEQTVAAACEFIGDSAEILVNVSEQGLQRTLANVERFAKHKFTHYVLQLPANNPFFTTDPLDYINQVVSHCDRPLYYYHVPPRNNFNLSAAQMKEIVANPGIVGIKNSSGNMYLRRELLLLKQEGIDFQLFEGQEWSIDEALALGCDGALCGFVSVGSKLMVNIAEAVAAGDLDKARELQNVLIRIFHGVYGCDLSTVWSGQKYALCRMGIFSSWHCLVHGQEKALTEERKQSIEKCLDEYRDYLD